MLCYSWLNNPDNPTHFCANRSILLTAAVWMYLRIRAFVVAPDSLETHKFYKSLTKRSGSFYVVIRSFYWLIIMESRTQGLLFVYRCQKERWPFFIRGDDCVCWPLLLLLLLLQNVTFAGGEVNRREERAMHCICFAHRNGEDVRWD